MGVPYLERYVSNAHAGIVSKHVQPSSEITIRSSGVLSRSGLVHKLNAGMEDVASVFNFFAKGFRTSTAAQETFYPD